VIEDAKFRNRASEPMERVITSPEIIRRGRLPALSTRLIDTANNGVNYLYLFSFLTSCGNQLNTSNNSSAGILVNAATNSLKHIDSLEDNNIYPGPVLEEMKDKREKKWVKVWTTEELFKQTSIFLFAAMLQLALARSHTCYLFAVKKGIRIIDINTQVT
jgi:hypothetical protein